MDTFPNIRETIGTQHCGPVCLLNMYTYLQMPSLPSTLDAILEELNIAGVDVSTYLPQLARNCHAHALETIIVSSNTHTVSPTWREKSKEEIVPTLKSWVTHNAGDPWLKPALFLLFYLQEGGNIKILDLSTHVLDDYLDQGYILLHCVEESWLWEKRKIVNISEYDDVKGHARGHFVVVYGKEGDQYLVSDPYPTKIEGRDGLYKVDKQKLLVSTLIWNPEFLAVKK